MKRLFMFLSLVFVLTLAACNAGEVSSDADKLSEAKDNLTIIADLDQVKTDLVLVTKGEHETTVSWESSNEAVVSNTGKVTRPSFETGNQVVTLTATITLNEISESKAFELTVIKLDEVVVEEPGDNDNSDDNEEPVSCATTATTPYEIDNAGFESGDLCGWTEKGDAYTNEGVTTEGYNWGGVDYNPEGTYHFNTWKQGGEETTGTLTSSIFEIGGSGWMSFRLGGGKNQEAIYVAVFKEDGTEIARFGNQLFNDSPQFFVYKADLSQFLGESAYIQIVDQANSDWGFFMLDSFNTYYESTDQLPDNATESINLVVGDTEAPVITAENQTIEVGTTSFDFKAIVTATDNMDTDLTLNYDQTVVNLNQVGDYELTYTVIDDYDNESHVTITVSVVDTVKPVFSGTRDFTIIIGETVDYLKGVTISDNYDANLNIEVDDSQVLLTTEGSYPLIYRTIDSSNNETTVEVTVNVVAQLSDTTAPVITGMKDLQVENFSNPDFIETVIATDDSGENILVSFDDSQIDLTQVGTYVLTYIATDSSGNEATASVNVEVVNYQVNNGSFENGDLSHWQVEGEAFTNAGVKKDDSKVGGYVFDTWYQEEQNGIGEGSFGKLTSETFELNGSGYMTFTIGGGAMYRDIYISIHNTTGEIARFGNTSVNGGDMIHYKADLSEYLGQELFIQVVDQSNREYGFYHIDAFITYIESEETIDENAIDAINILPQITGEDAPYSIINGGFENADLYGWTVVDGNSFSNDGVWGYDHYWGGQYGKEGNYFFSNEAIGGDGNTGTLRSSTFELGGTGWISFQLGGAAYYADKEDVYLSVKLTDGTEIAKFYNTAFESNGYLNHYKADLSDYLGQEMVIEIIDNRTSDWGWIAVDSINTYYANEADLPTEAILATYE